MARMQAQLREERDGKNVLIKSANYCNGIGRERVAGSFNMETSLGMVAVQRESDAVDGKQECESWLR